MRIIAFEGLDNVGKSTIAKGVAKQLEARGKRVEIRHPFDTEFGKKTVRPMLKEVEVGSNNTFVAALTLAAHVKFCEEVQAIPEGSLDYLFMDRSIISSVAYQGQAILPVLHAFKLSYGSIIIPPLVFYIDASKEVRLARALQKGDKVEVNDLSDEIQGKAEKGYRDGISFAREYGSYVVQVNNSTTDLNLAVSIVCSRLQ